MWRPACPKNKKVFQAVLVPTILHISAAEIMYKYEQFCNLEAKFLFVAEPDSRLRK